MNKINQLSKNQLKRDNEDLLKAIYDHKFSYLSNEKIISTHISNELLQDHLATYENDSNELFLRQLNKTLAQTMNKYEELY